MIGRNRCAKARTSDSLSTSPVLPGGSKPKSPERRLDWVILAGVCNRCGTSYVTYLVILRFIYLKTKPLMKYFAASAASKGLAQNPKRASSLAPRGTSAGLLNSFGAAVRGLCALNGMLKKAIWSPLPLGRGSVSVCKRVTAFVSRARQQAVFGPFQLPVKDPAQNGLAPRSQIRRARLRFGPAARGGISALLLTSALVGANLPSNYFTGQGARMTIGQATFTDAMPGTSERLLGSVGGVAYAADRSE